MLGRTASSSFAHDFWKWWFDGRGKCKFLYRSEFYTHEYKNHDFEPENSLLNICIQIKWTYETPFETWTYMTKNCPSWKSPLKIEIFLSQILIIRDIQNLPRYICFWGWQKGWYILKKKKLRITKVVKIQDGRQSWPPNFSWYKIN